MQTCFTHYFWLLMALKCGETTKQFFLRINGGGTNSIFKKKSTKQTENGINSFLRKKIRNGTIWFLVGRNVQLCEANRHWHVLTLDTSRWYNECSVLNNFGGVNNDELSYAHVRLWNAYLYSAHDRRRDRCPKTIVFVSQTRIFLKKSEKEIKRKNYTVVSRAHNCTGCGDRWQTYIFVTKIMRWTFWRPSRLRPYIIIIIKITARKQHYLWRTMPPQRI